jgi:hypothetical protein
MTLLGASTAMMWSELSAGYEFRKETIAGTHGNERDAP